MKIIDKTKKYALFFDVDGTLLIDNKLSEENISAINYVKNEGHYIFINSGRGMYNLAVDEIKKVKWDGYLSGSTYLTFENKVLFSKFIDKKAIEEVITLCKKINVCCVLEGLSANYAINSEATKSTISIPGYVKEIIATYPKIDSIDDLNKFYEEINASKITFMSVVDDKYLEGNEYFDFVQFKDYTEGLQKGYNKATLMKKIGDFLDIPRENMIAFGDSLNDLQMMEYAGIKVAINGSPEKITGIADYVTKGKKDGVAEAILALFKKNN